METKSMFLVLLLLLHIPFSACTSTQEENLIFLLSVSYQIGRFSARSQSSRMALADTRFRPAQTIMAAASINPNAFSALNERLLNAGKVQKSGLDNISSTAIKKSKVLPTTTADLPFA
jgi:hypothetical protein